MIFLKSQKDKILKKVSQKEEKFISKVQKPNQLKEKISDKIPDKLEYTLNTAFEKAFSMLFTKGDMIIEKTINSEKISSEYDVLNYTADKIPTKKNINKIDGISRKSNLINSSFVTAGGIAMGFFGVGMPDIAIFTSALLKGIYETASSYGFVYSSEEEKVYILRLIRTALSENESRYENNAELDSMVYGDLNEEISLTAKALAKSMLMEKFIQGIPIVGVVGGISNNIIYRKVLKFAKIKYKKRYLSK